ncbi:DUF2929 family protein [Lentibacillus sediminis]|uniref:DUF2929 family protein n=1 Tax=Lentibacillus sediminis TaxID=1940529 RepID=UPI000C1BFA20|nr:DUF2929 family protein [Lentibacillus sediminis]
MKYLMTILWAFLISMAISYVLVSMSGDPFVIQDTLILAGIMSIAVFVLGGALEQKNAQ